MDEILRGNAVESAPTGYYEGGPKSIGPVSMKMRLKAAVERAEKQLADAKRAKELLEKNPDLEELLNILGRANF